MTGGSWMVERRTFAVDKTTEGPCCFFLSASSSLFITLALTHSCMHVCFTFYFLLFPSPTYSRQKSIGLFSLSPTTTAFMTVMTYIDTRCFRPYASLSPSLSLFRVSWPLSFLFLVLSVQGWRGFRPCRVPPTLQSVQRGGFLNETEKQINLKKYSEGRGGGGVGELAMDSCFFFHSLFHFF